MSFLDDLLTNSLIAGASTSRSKLPKLIVGLLAIALACGLLFYYLSWEPAAVETYRVEDISYARCYYDDKSDDRKIVLESGGKAYRLYPYIWQDKYDAATVVRELGRHSEAKVWLPSNGDPFIKGIATPTLTIDPSMGAAWDRSNRKAMLWVIGGFFLAGAVLIVVAILS